MLRKRALLPFAGFAAVCLSFPLLTVEVLGWAIFWAPGMVFKNCYSFKSILKPSFNLYLITFTCQWPLKLVKMINNF